MANDNDQIMQLWEVVMTKLKTLEGKIPVINVEAGAPEGAFETACEICKKSGKKVLVTSGFSRGELIYLPWVDVQLNITMKNNQPRVGVTGQPAATAKVQRMLADYVTIGGK